MFPPLSEPELETQRCSIGGFRGPKAYRASNNYVIESCPGEETVLRSIRGRDDLGIDGNVLGSKTEVDREVLARGLDLVHGPGGDGGSPDVDVRQLGQGRDLVQACVRHLGFGQVQVGQVRQAGDVRSRSIGDGVLLQAQAPQVGKAGNGLDLRVGDAGAPEV